jgi:hypothetical protein
MHIGVVTSDYGAGDAAGTGCEASPGGQRGILQTLPSPRAIDPPPGCQAPKGKPYIEYAFDPKGGAPTTNLPNGNDAQALEEQFKCMASVGAKGCGFEHQLESVYAALTNTNENAGFLREGALLTVVFVTNEDDGSAKPNAKFYENANFDMYGDYDTYRQTRFALQCGGSPIPYSDGAGAGLPQMLAQCVATPNPLEEVNIAYDISRYTKLFTQPGGIKKFPEDVILFGIDGPDDQNQLQTILAKRGTGLGTAPYPAYDPCGPLLSGGCVMRIQHSCQNMAAPEFFADPAIRLNAVINSSKFHKVTSICGDDPTHQPVFTGALQTLAHLITSNISPGCIPAPLTHVDDPECVAVDVTDNGAAPPTQKAIPSCKRSGGAFPCWRVEVKAQCKSLSPDSVGITIDRNGQPAPPNTNLRVNCATKV